MKKNYLFLPVVFLILIFACEKTANDCCLFSTISELDTSKLNRKVLVLGIDGIRSDAMMQGSVALIYQI